MVNIYKLTNILESGMSIFQLTQWKEEGIWFPISQYKKVSNEIEVVTNLFLEGQESFYIQLTGNYTTGEEQEEWKTFLEENQWKIYPLLKNILACFLPGKLENYQVLYTVYPAGFISVIAKPII